MGKVGMSFTVVLSAFSALIAACSTGNIAASRCPPEFPVERDGFCYAAGGDSSAMDSGAVGDTGPGGDDTGATGDDTGATGDDTGTLGDEAGSPDGATDVDADAVDGGGAPDGSPVICVREHPLVMGTRRYCNPGDCFCATPDSCVPEDIAAACCEVPVVCAGDGGIAPGDAGPSVICVGEHPRFTGMGTLRYCDPGNCYCGGTSDICYPMDTAAACCSIAVVCY